MEGPTPVSALIHAATMVTAGVYLVARSSIIFAHAPAALAVVGVVGCLTAFFAATIALTQNDLKRMLAYSTISQLGYMFLGCGVGVFAAGIFHLMTHAFFKSLLFLAAGSVMHAMSGELDMRKMGGLRHKLKITYATFLIATIAISGIPPCGVLQQGRNSGGGLRRTAGQTMAVLAGDLYRRADGLLHVSRPLHDLFREVPCPAGNCTAPARKQFQDDDPDDGAGVFLRGCRMGKLAQSLGWQRGL